MIEGFNSIIIPVSDLKEATEFYEKVLGLKKELELPFYVKFNCGGVEIGLEPGGIRGTKEGSLYIMLLVDDIDKEYEELKKKGVRFKGEPKDTSWGGRVAGLTDPDGNTVGLLQWKEK